MAAAVFAESAFAVAASFVMWSREPAVIAIIVYSLHALAQVVVLEQNFASHSSPPCTEKRSPSIDRHERLGIFVVFVAFASFAVAAQQQHYSSASISSQCSTATAASIQEHFRQ